MIGLLALLRFKQSKDTHRAIVRFDVAGCTLSKSAMAFVEAFAQGVCEPFS